MRAILPATVALLAIGAVPLAGQLPAPPVPSACDEPEIVVIARKLRRVRLNYVMRGPYVRSCAAGKSSGDDRVDRIMCAILRSCVAAGHRDVAPARACMMARIDTLDGLAADALAAQAAAPPTPVQPDPPELIVTGQQPDIVVTGPVPAIRGGLWRFERSATLTFGRSTPPVQGFAFTQCLPPGALEAMLRRVAGEGETLPRTDRCGRLRMTIGDGRLRGSRSCVRADIGQGGVRYRELSLTGQFDARRLTLNYAVEQEHDGAERTGTGPWIPGAPVGYRWRVLAARAGDCPAQPRTDQRTMAEAVDRLFAHDGSDREFE